ncbi:hypothetical protein L1887_51544 [Cichorium endivia]|nr:hypothetical protein L1887_51544 [Cichorium endivia]
MAWRIRVGAASCIQSPAVGSTRTLASKQRRPAEDQDQDQDQAADPSLPVPKGSRRTGVTERQCPLPTHCDPRHSSVCGCVRRSRGRVQQGSSPAVPALWRGSQAGQGGEADEVGLAGFTRPTWPGLAQTASQGSVTLCCWVACKSTHAIPRASSAGAAGARWLDSPNSPDLPLSPSLCLCLLFSLRPLVPQLARSAIRSQAASLLSLQATRAQCSALQAATLLAALNLPESLLHRSLVTAIHRSLSLAFSPSSAHLLASQPTPYPLPPSPLQPHPLCTLGSSSLGTSARRTPCSLGGRPVAHTVRSTGSRYLYAFPYPSPPLAAQSTISHLKASFSSGPHLYTSPSPRSLPCSTPVDLGEPPRPSGAFCSRFRLLLTHPWPRPSHNYPYTLRSSERQFGQAACSCPASKVQLPSVGTRAHTRTHAHTFAQGLVSFAFSPKSFRTCA